MTKLLVETNGDYSLYDLLGRQTIESYRPTVVTQTGFITRMRDDRLTVLEKLADDASDEALAEARNAEELAAAIEALPRPAKPAAPKPAEKPAPVAPAKPKGK